MEISHKRLDFWLRLAVRMSWELGALTSTQSHGSGLAAHLSGGADPASPPQPAPRLRPPAAARTTERRRLSGTLGSCLPSPCGQLGFVTSDDRTRSVSHGARRWRVSHYPPGPCSFSPDTAVLLRTRPPRGDTGGRARSSLAVGRSGDGSEPRLPPVGGHPSAFGGAVGAEMGASEV